MSADYYQYQYQPQPIPPDQTRRSGCMRRGCIIGCVAVLILGLVLFAATIFAGFAVSRYIASLPPGQAPCTLMSIGLRVMDQAIENPSPTTTPQQLADMRKTRDQIQAEYNRRCSSSSTTRL